MDFETFARELVEKALESRSKPSEEGQGRSENGPLTMEELDQKLDNLRQLANQFQKISQETYNQIRRQRNTLVSFNTLPPEVLVLIFQAALDGKLDLKRVKNILAFRQVCCHWRTIIDEAPSLWSRISSNFAASQILTALSLSKEHSLEVEMNAYKRGFFLEMLPYSYRWETACLGFVPRATEIELQSLSTIKSRRLKVLNITWARTEGMLEEFRHPPIVLFKEPAEKLECLHLHGAHIELGPWNLPRLTCLTLNAMHFPWIKAEQVLNLLHSLPNLSTLALLHFGDPHDQSVPSYDVKELLNLKYVTMLHIPHHLAKCLVGAIRAPSCRAFSLKAHHADNADVSDLLDETLTQWAVTVRKNMLGDVQWSVAMTKSFTCFVQQKGQEARFSVTLGRCQLATASEWTSALLSEESSNDMEVLFTGDLDFDDQHVRRLFRGVNPTEIHCKSKEEVALRFLKHLKTPVEEVQGVCFPCPRLRILHIANWEIEMLIDMLRVRQGKGDAPSADGEQVSLPAPLGTLEICGPNFKDLERLREVLDPEQIVARGSNYQSISQWS